MGRVNDLSWPLAYTRYLHAELRVWASGQLKSFTRPISCFIIISQENHSRRPDWVTQRTTNSSQDHRSPVLALSSHHSSRVLLGEARLLTLSRGQPWSRMTFVVQGVYRGQRPRSRPTAHRYSCPVVPSQYLSRAPLGHPTTYL